MRPYSFYIISMCLFPPTSQPARGGRKGREWTLSTDSREANLFVRLGFGPFLFDCLQLNLEVSDLACTIQTKE